MNTSYGTVRDRTHQFISYREKGKKLSSASVYNDFHSGGETTRLLQHGAESSSSDIERGTHVSRKASRDPTLALRREVQEKMSSIRTRMEDIRVLHGKASLNTFDDARDDEVAVEIATEQITALFRSCEKALLACNGGNAAASQVERTIQNNMQKTLALDLQKLSLEFRKQQKNYLVRLRERDGRNSTAANALGVLDDEGTTDTFLSEMQSLVVDSSAALAQERDREVVKIVGSIHDLGVIMKDLSTLVIEQGTVLDRIDYTLQQTSSVVEQGVSQLKRAEKAQRRGILASCVLILCAMIAFLFVILVIKSIL
jgi:syntaxin 16